MRFYEIFDSHVQYGPIARVELFVQGVAKVDPEVFTILVQEPEAKIILFQNTHSFANLQRMKEDINCLVYDQNNVNCCISL